MSSFWTDCILIVTPGFSSWNAAIASFQNCWPGPVVEFCQSVISTLPSLFSSEPPALQPASARAPTTSAADPARILLRFM